MRGQSILTAIGADHVCRQGQIRDRTITRCAGKVKRSMPPSDWQGPTTLLLNADRDGGGNDSSIQAHRYSRLMTSARYGRSVLPDRELSSWTPPLFQCEIKVRHWYWQEVQYRSSQRTRQTSPWNARDQNPRWIASYCGSRQMSWRGQPEYLHK